MPDDILRVTLRLKAIDDLFRDPDLSPFDPYYSPATCVAGMDYLVGEMQRRPGDTPTELTILLPPEQLAACPDLEAHAHRHRALFGGVGQYRAAGTRRR